MLESLPDRSHPENIHTTILSTTVSTTFKKISAPIKRKLIVVSIKVKYKIFEHFMLRCY